MSSVFVCLAALHAQDYKAKVIERIGMVSLFDGKYNTPLSVGDAVAPTQMIVTGPDGYGKFQVTDGSTFEVFANSRLEFRRTLGNWKDLLNLWIGRVKVMIQHAPGQPNHNEVSSPTAVISVRGTVFDVQVEDEDGTTLVTVDEGTVWVRNSTAAGNTRVLTQGEYVRVFRNQPLAQNQIDKGNIIRRAMKAAEDAIYQALIQQRAGGVGGSPVPGNGPVAQGDKGKGGTTTTAPGGAPPPPGAAPPPPGGG